MCGIVSYTGCKPGYSHILNGLSRIQNRGYDSTGIGCVSTTSNQTPSQPSIHISKYTCDTYDPVKMLSTPSGVFLSSCNLVGHTRWATHGENTVLNAHPHRDNGATGKFTLVHNGVIENYDELRTNMKPGVSFLSETDTEVIVNQISVCYSKPHLSSDCNPIDENQTQYCHLTDTESRVVRAIHKALSMLHGSWAIVVLCSDTPGVSYVSRKESPLLVGYAQKYMMAASEPSGFEEGICTYRCIPENLVCVMKQSPPTDNTREPDEYVCYPLNDPTYDRTHPFIPYENHETVTSPDPYPHWMLKEIYEQPTCVGRLVRQCIGDDRDNPVVVTLPIYEMESVTESTMSRMLGIDHLILLACGTSYHAGLYSSGILQQISGFHSVQVLNAYNFNQNSIPKSGTVGVLMLSQSGETKDLLNCFSVIKQNNLFVLSIVNRARSSIARESDVVLSVNAGKETAVASTKSFTGQIIVLYVLAIWYTQQRNTHAHDRDTIMSLIHSMERLEMDIETTLRKTQTTCKHLASELSSSSTVFILGKAGSESMALEGCLKWKEIGYIHASGYNSSALRHGPFALLTRHTPVVLLNSGVEHYEKNNTIAIEVSSRNSPVIGVSDQPLDSSIYSNSIRVESNTWFHEFLCILPLQMISYYIALEKGHNPDFPRNLAKTITVD